MLITVEYLAIFERSGTFCDSSEQLLKLLQVDSTLVVRGSDVLFNAKRLAELRLSSGEVAGKEQRYFQLKFLATVDPKDSTSLADVQGLLRAVRSVVGRAGGTTEILRDDISAYYGQQAYPLIQETENLMRQLIANFMLVTVGREWEKETLPKNVEAAVKSSKRRSEGANVLYALDFVHLGDFLFDAYATMTPAQLHARLGTCKSAEDIAALQDAIPRSNWSRYFEGLVECQDSYLSSVWKDLYELRCKVAHNGMVSRSDFESTQELAAKIKPVLTNALGKIFKVHVPPEAMEQLAEQAARGRSTAIGDFVAAWQELESVVFKLNPTPRGFRRNNPVLWFFDDTDGAEYVELRGIRNRVVHGPPEGVAVDVLQNATSRAQRLVAVASRADYVQHLLGLSQDERNAELERLIDATLLTAISNDDVSDYLHNRDGVGVSMMLEKVALKAHEVHGRECVVPFTYHLVAWIEGSSDRARRSIHRDATMYVDERSQVRFHGISLDDPAEEPASATPP